MTEDKSEAVILFSFTCFFIVHDVVEIVSEAAEFIVFGVQVV